MKYKNLFILLLLLLNISTNKVFAVSAYPYPITIKQPDNTELTIQLVGDEFFHYTQTTDGLLIQQNEREIFEYADLNSVGTLMLSGIKVNDVTKRTDKELEGISKNCFFLFPIRSNYSYRIVIFNYLLAISLIFNTLIISFVHCWTYLSH